MLSFFVKGYNEIMEFISFPKIPRYSRDCVITEKIDGTNASVWIEENTILAASRMQFITPEQDNYGFARWVYDNSKAIIDLLGNGTHYGEWWGGGIQRKYGMEKGEKQFSLFNTDRWKDLNSPLINTVPVIYEGEFTTDAILSALDQLQYNSLAAPGFKDPEGIVIFHVAANQLFKKTFEKDEIKGY